MVGPAGSPWREHYALFDTLIGSCGVAWSGRAGTGLPPPESDRSGTERRLQANGTDPDGQAPPPDVERVIADLRRYLEGEPVDFSAIGLDLAGVSAFPRKVYDAARSIVWGKTAS